MLTNSVAAVSAEFLALLLVNDFWLDLKNCCRIGLFRSWALGRIITPFSMDLKDKRSL